ncbi:hypothetical protein THRCLA_20234 [Thraustotheca clavata]|uniref:Uncharacterized protein n=1 Tax=Thraustotheca clavata TaxID=74557 RepID=A0A1W0A9Q3_9STRA|nr:hypothetical protein THRCLA_20234 [Thraustotheca clavata]
MSSSKDLLLLLQDDLKKEQNRLQSLAAARTESERERLEKRFNRERDHVRKLIHVLQKDHAAPRSNQSSEGGADSDSLKTSSKKRSKIACDNSSGDFHRYMCRKVAKTTTRPLNEVTLRAVFTYLVVHQQSEHELLMTKYSLLQQLHSVVAKQQRKLQDDQVTVRSAVSSFKSLALSSHSSKSFRSKS